IFLILLNLFLLILGAILDIFSALVIMVPLILPIAVSYGIDPIHLGIIFLANMQIGYFTPPVGMNLFIASYRFKKPIGELYRATIPFMIVLLAAMLVITYWPALSLVLLKR
ncbi:MAG TPA: TRAP transporter large permease subunit, partial [Desulfobacterales bacterium]|nr:TRAP transporter large permease subunit [Desulfobacterales bacterium]